jgi:hypothetical protein
VGRRGAQGSVPLWLKTLGELTVLPRSEARLRPTQEGAAQIRLNNQKEEDLTPEASSSALDSSGGIILNANDDNNDDIYNDKGYEPKEHMQGDEAASLILYWLVSLYLRHVIEFLAYVIATIYWGA